MKTHDLKKQLILLKEESKLNMTESQRKKINKIIHTSSLASGSVGAGLAQLPGSDSAIIVPIQINMIRQIGKEFGIKLTESSAETILGTAVATMTGRALSQFLVGWLPIAGNILNASTAAIVTEVLGWLIANNFSREQKYFK